MAMKLTSIVLSTCEHVGPVFIGVEHVIYVITFHNEFL